MDRVTQADLAALLALSPGILLLVDTSGRLRHAGNPDAKAVATGGMLAVKDGLLTARRQSEDKALRDLLATLRPGHGTATLCLRNREGLPVLVIDLHLLASGLVAVRVVHLASHGRPSEARMREIFAFTPAEARVAAGLLAGLGITAVARQHGVEPETVRGQVKRIRSKTGARSVGELLLQLAATTTA